MVWRQNPDTGESYWVDDAPPPPPPPGQRGPVPAFGGDTSHISNVPDPSAFTPLPGTQAVDPTGRNIPPPAPPPGFADPNAQPELPTDPLANGGAPPAESQAAPPVADGPAEVDRTRIDQILAGVSEVGSYLKAIGLSTDQYSAAQAQLQIALEQAQTQALQLARSGNRRGRAGAERQAAYQQTQLQTDASRSAALLRAEEEEKNKQIKIDAFTRAGEMGLNAGALDLDVQNLDMQAATNYLNQLFEDHRLGLQLDQQEAERVTNFVRDMALIAKDYYALNLQEKQSVRDDLTRRYGISEEVRVALAKLDAEPGFFEKAALGMVEGGSGALATFALASDVTAKEGFADGERELDELLSNVSAQTWQYKDEKHGVGRFTGPMAQELQKSAIGKSMVARGDDGYLHVDGGRAGLAALSGLSLVYDKLKQLEEGL
jgi:hypothetical protein